MRLMGKANPRYGERATYGAIHQFLAKQARGHCQCGRVAEEWALKREANSKEIDAATGFEFSRSLDDYQPMCKKCHRGYDQNSQKMWDRDHEGRAAKQARGKAHWTKQISTAAYPRGNAKLNLQAVRVIRWALRNGRTGRLLSRIYSISEAAVSTIKTGERWEGLT